MTVYATAEDIINTALQELGMGSVRLAAAAADQTGYQLLGLLNALGEEILRAHDWQALELTMTFTGDGVTESFGLPSNFGRMVNQTAWAVSDARPMLGPQSPQVWAWNKYGIVAAGVQFQYRILNGRMDVFPTPGAGEEFALYYIANTWVAIHGNIFDGATKVVNADDVCGFDRRLLIAGLKAKFWAMKGFDTTALQSEFDFMLANEKAATQGARVLDLSYSGAPVLIGWQNVPEGNTFGM